MSKQICEKGIVVDDHSALISTEYHQRTLTRNHHLPIEESDMIEELRFSCPRPLYKSFDEKSPQNGITLGNQLSDSSFRVEVVKLLSRSQVT